ncbi:hypothetical protein Slin15195_G070340 [Septoria linicola]|uniref:Uncharacterized protein n=1 Tax=Septoria linicola TaxID=215465 RepID=A0A9Q9EK55_9PEZI|nr:hypothetical protein Slin14017_G103090 [Septoria linicola]USW53715.1 hypothetical protein Slin15195_G070340 [Septoria linicola]
MRFEDWDVLLFPGGGQDAHIPLQEFCVECYAITDDRLLKGETITAPLMTGFVASLEPGRPFSISLHSWRPKPFSFRPAAETRAKAPQVWQFKVIVDGEVRCADTMTADVQWPKVIHEATAHAAHDGNPEQLLFPPFHEDRIRERQWHPYGDKGRIKIEIAEGFLQKRDGHTEFVKLTVHAIFNFLHAPMNILRDCGKAWPCQYVLEKKRLTAPHLAQDRPADNEREEFQEPERFRHHTGGPQKRSQQRHNSGYQPLPLSSPMYNNMPGMPPPTPSYAFDGYPGHSYYDGRSSRSTSAYSNISHSAMPLMAHYGPTLPMPSYSSGETMFASTPVLPYDPNVEIHIPSDQLHKVVTLLEQRANGSAMAPPPLPAHVMEAKASLENSSSMQRDMEDDDMVHTVHSRDRRAASRSNFSDVSMHAGCAEFPGCTTEDREGQIIHHEGREVAPAAVMRGRKEGQNDQTNRDFLSTILNDDPDETPDAQGAEEIDPDSPEPTSMLSNDSGKKRTRASATSLSINEDGSPEKQDKGSSKPARKLRKRDAAAMEDA